MTDQPYTPGIRKIREEYAQAFGIRFLEGTAGALEHFDQTLALDVAAAEQRGAARGKVEGLREAADEAGSWGPACINAALAIRRSADLLEGVE